MRIITFNLLGKTAKCANIHTISQKANIFVRNKEMYYFHGMNNNYE